MKLSQSAIDEFKQIYCKQYGVTLTDEEANSKGLELLQFMKIIYKPIPKQSENNSDKV